MPNSNTSSRDRETAAPQSTHSNLDQQYRAIGISAVAAAIRYQTEPSRQAETPVRTRETD